MKLRRECVSGRALAGFRIPQPRFPPTYRVARGVAGFAYVEFEAELRFVAAVRRREEKIRRHRARRLLVQKQEAAQRSQLQEKIRKQEQKWLQPLPQVQLQQHLSQLDHDQLINQHSGKERLRDRKVQKEESALPKSHRKKNLPSRLLQGEFESVASVELGSNEVASKNKNNDDDAYPASASQSASKPEEYKSDGSDTSTASSDSSDEDAAQRRRNIHRRSRHSSMAMEVHTVHSPVSSPTTTLTPHSAAIRQQLTADAAKMKFEEVANATACALRSAPQQAVDTARHARAVASAAASAAATDAHSAALAAEAVMVQRYYSRERRIPKLPAYCDRIAWHSAHGLSQRLRAHAFRAGADFVTSDHKPVYIRLSVKPTPPLPPPLTIAQAKVLAFKRAHHPSSPLPQAPKLRFDAVAGPLRSLKHATESLISNLNDKVSVIPTGNFISNLNDKVNIIPTTSLISSLKDKIRILPVTSSASSRTTTPTASANSSSSLDSNNTNEWNGMPEMVLELEFSDLHGKSLPAGDFSGFSDPYLVFLPNPSPPHQPAVAVDDTGNALLLGVAPGMDVPDIDDADGKPARTSVQLRTLKPHWPDVIIERIPIPSPWRPSLSTSSQSSKNDHLEGKRSANVTSNGSHHEGSSNHEKSNAGTTQSNSDSDCSSTDEDEPRFSQGRSSNLHGRPSKGHHRHHKSSVSGSNSDNTRFQGTNTTDTKNSRSNSESVGCDFWSTEPQLPYLGRVSLLAMDRDPLTSDSVLGSCSLSLRECVLQARKATLFKLSRSRAAARQAGKIGERIIGSSSSSNNSSIDINSISSSGFIGAWHFRRDLARCGVAHGELRGVVRVTMLDGRTGLPYPVDLPEHLVSESTPSAALGSRLVYGLTQWLLS